MGGRGRRGRGGGGQRRGGGGRAACTCSGRALGVGNARRRAGGGPGGRPRGPRCGRGAALRKRPGPARRKRAVPPPCADDAGPARPTVPRQLCGRRTGTRPAAFRTWRALGPSRGLICWGTCGIPFWWPPGTDPSLPRPPPVPPRPPPRCRAGGACGRRLHPCGWSCGGRRGAGASWRARPEPQRGHAASVTCKVGPAPRGDSRCRTASGSRRGEAAAGV